MSDTITRNAKRTSTKSLNLKQQRQELIVPKEYKSLPWLKFFNSQNFYIEYGRFHRDETNKLIHFLFIPVICWTIQAFIQYSPWTMQTEVRYGDDGYSVRIGKFDMPTADEQRTVFWSNYWSWSLYGAIVFTIDPVIGCVVFLVSQCGIQLLLALIHLDEKEGMFNGNLFQIIVGIHVFSWCTQFVGHGIYEKRAPAILTNLFFLFLAPFFETLEFVNLVFGYRDAEKQALLKIIDADIAYHKLSRGYPVPANVDATAFTKKKQN